MKTNVTVRENSQRLFLFCILSMICIISFATTHTVQVADYSFTPATTTAVVGDTIIWNWVSGSHTTTSISVPGAAATWNSPINNTSTTFQYVVAIPGVYNYHCTMHPSLMTGTINVSAATEIAEANDPVKVTVYPNPSPGRFEVIAPKAIQSIQIYDMLGNTIYSAQINSDIAAVDLNRPADGVYFMRLLFENKGNIDMKKIIIGN